MLGTDLPAWRKRNGLTQEALMFALGVRSRTTMISREKSSEPLDNGTELALLALEHLPDLARKIIGRRYKAAELPAVRGKVWAEREYPGRKEPIPLEESDFLA
jgi:transcriptional regulator with XRE-family HTH domain